MYTHVLCIDGKKLEEDNTSLMDFTGSRTIKATRSVVFQALLTPEVLKNSIPGCESAELVNTPQGQQLKLVVTTGIPGFKGPYTIYLQANDVIAPSHMVLVTEPNSSVGSVKANCAIDLTDDAAGTLLSYNANAATTGKIASVPEMIIKPGVKGALDQFFKNFEKQVSTVNA